MLFVSEGDKELGYAGKPIEGYRDTDVKKLRYFHDHIYLKLSGLNQTTGYIKVKENIGLKNDPKGTEGFFTTEDEIKK